MPRKTRKAGEDQGIVYSCNAYLNQRWEDVLRQFDIAAPGEPENPLGEGHELISLIRESLRSQALTYHYVLPTQLLAKCVDSNLDVHALQAGYGVEGSFDARTIAHDVIVPFDRTNHRVLGGSPEPYVNNPLRVPAVTSEYRGAQKNKAEWDKLVAVLDAVQTANDEVFTRRVFDQALFEIYRMLAGVAVTYPTPNRISLKRTYELVQAYLAVKSGGDRMEAVCAALFRTIGNRFGLFDQVKREKVNAPDAPSGLSADIECWLNNKIVLLVEVKDRTLTLTAVDTKLDGARSRHISEILFIAEQGREPGDMEGIDARVSSEFTSGQNIYVTNFADFSLGIFILFGEGGRTQFLGEVGKELDRAGSRIEHRRAWADLLKLA
jgi:hypothetical protein